MRAFPPFAVACATALPLVVGCSRPPSTPIRMPARVEAAPAGVEHKVGAFIGARGTRLFEQSWRPAGEVRGALVVVHGLKDHSDNYRVLAERLAQAGIAVYAFDLRGHGRSEGMRVWVESFDDYLEDLDHVLGEVRAREAGKPVFLFGHSMGGAIATLYVLQRAPELRGLVLSGAALATDVSGVKIAGTKAIAALAPTAGVFELDLHNFSRDPAVVARGLADPLVYQPGAPAHTALELLRAIDRIQEHLDDVTVPILAMHGGADVVTPPAGSKALIDRARSADKTLKIYPDLFHDLLHEPEREQVTSDLVAWITARAAPASVKAP